jgi:hypothetical protein
MCNSGLIGMPGQGGLGLLTQSASKPLL